MHALSVQCVENELFSWIVGVHYHCPRKQKVSTTDLKKSRLVFCIPFYSKTKHKPMKKIWCCDFLLNLLEWLCSDVFSWLLICTNSLSPHLRLHYPPPPPNKQKSPGYIYICLFTDVSPGHTDVCSESCGMSPTL